MKKLATSVAALGTALALVLAYDAATYAGTGSSLILGKVNKSSKVTTITRTSKGPALSLTTKSGPPLAVSSKAKVVKLNADKVDGKDASALGTSARTFTIPDTSGFVANFTVDLPVVPAGQYLVSYSVAGDANGTGVHCNLARIGASPADSVFVAYASGVTNSDGEFGVSATSVVSISKGDDAKLTCRSLTSTFRVLKAVTRPSTVTMLRLDSNKTSSAG